MKIPKISSKQRNIKTIMLVTFVSTFFFTGCEIKPPKCSDNNVKDILIDIYENNIRKSDNIYLKNLTLMANFPKIKDINSIVNTSYDANIRSRTCEANLIFENDKKIDITYSVFVSDDNEVIVKLDKESVKGLLMQMLVE